MSQPILVKRIPRSKRAKASTETTRRMERQSLRLVLNIEGSAQPYFVPLIERMLIGRSAGEVDIDLAGFGAMQNGISRVHAAFVYEEGALFLEDLNSTNGTRINGYELNPHQRYLLRNGDEIELGSLRFNIRLVRAPG